METPEMIQTLITGGISAIITAYGMTLKSNMDARKSKQTEYQEVLQANAAFRDEIRKDLEAAKMEIQVLRTELRAKDSLILTLQNQIGDLNIMVMEMNTKKKKKLESA
jgi:predicted  nucleic acid-binding Zn-ribbon protein